MQHPVYHFMPQNLVVFRWIISAHWLHLESWMFTSKLSFKICLTPLNKSLTLFFQLCDLQSLWDYLRWFLITISLSHNGESKLSQLALERVNNDLQHIHFPPDPVIWLVRPLPPLCICVTCTYKCNHACSVLVCRWLCMYSFVVDVFS